MRLSFPLFRRREPGGAVERLVVGLGNPGARHVANRHNVGFQVADRLAASAELRFDERRDRALLARGVIENIRVALVKPQTFMNLSGTAVTPIARFYRVPVEHILVVCDDLDLPLGTLRLRLEGGSGGHRGITSLIDCLDSQGFPRLRVGIGRPPGRMPPEAYVLRDFDADERAVIEQAYEQAVRAIRTALCDGFQAAMNQFN
jgi:PTH1 family peptidyl-tRNA hydrolase